jgi:hypothetical protein
LFENNVFRDLAYEATDTGAWYSLYTHTHTERERERERERPTDRQTHSHTYTHIHTHTHRYSGRSWVRRGHVIRGNLFERIYNTDVMALGYACVMGIYLDDMLAGVSIVNNTFRHVQVLI